jgi:lipopolysaccharide transport system permease protein
MKAISPSNLEALIGAGNPVRILRGLWQHRDLLLQMTRREMTQRYRGTYLGMLWALLTPLMMLLIYTFVFSVVLQARWGQMEEAMGVRQFALTLFAGLIPFSVFSEVVNGAPTLIVQVPNYVKKVVFPLQILPLCTVGSAVIHSLISVGILVAGIALGLGFVSPMIVLLPLAYVPLLLLCLGLGWFLAALGVYIRDIRHSVGLAVQVLFFMSPIFYPITAVPEPLRIVFYVNPLTTILDGFRQTLLWRQPLSWGPWTICTVITAVMAVLGYVWFMKTRPGFADVM